MTTITQTLDSLTNPINRATMTAAEVSVAGDTTISELTTIFGQVNTLTPQINTVAGEVNANAVAVESSTAVALSASNFKGDYDDLTDDLAVPASVYKSGQYWMLLSDLTDVTAKVPGVDVEWAALILLPSSVAKTSTGTLSAADLTGKTIHNDGSGGAINLQWPTMADGQEATFYVNDAQYLKVTAPTGKTFRVGQQQSAFGGYIRSNVVGSRCHVKAMPDELVIFEYDGVWVYDE